MSYLLDTNAVSEWVKPRPDPGIVAWLDEVDEDRTYLSVITLGELRKGVDRLADRRRRDRLDRWLSGDLPERFSRRLLRLTPPWPTSGGNCSPAPSVPGRPSAASMP